MTAINDHEFLVIERDGTSGDPAGFKRIFKVDTDILDAQGFAQKSEVVDLMSLADPNDLNGDGLRTFNFPFVTIEDVLILDPSTLLVITTTTIQAAAVGVSAWRTTTSFCAYTSTSPLQ